MAGDGRLTRYYLVRFVNCGKGSVVSAPRTPEEATRASLRRMGGAVDPRGEEDLDVGQGGGGGDEPSDELLAVFRPHWIIYVRPLLLLVVVVVLAVVGVATAMLFVPPEARSGVGLPAVLAGCGIAVWGSASFIQALIYREMTSLQVFGDHLLYQQGWLSRRTRGVMVSEIVGTNLFQSMVGQRLGMGDVQFETRGVDTLALGAFERVVELKSLVDGLAREMRRRNPPNLRR